MEIQYDGLKDMANAAMLGLKTWQKTLNYLILFLNESSVLCFFLIIYVKYGLSK